MLRTKTISAAILRALSEERRRITSDWRMLLLARRFALKTGLPLPDAETVVRVLRAMVRAEDLQPVRGAPGIYRVDVPYAQNLETSEEQIIQEANPWAVFSYLSALAHHGLTNQIPRRIYVTHYLGRARDRLPLGTTPEDWADIAPPSLRFPKKVDSTEVIWTRTKAEWEFGHVVSYSAGQPIYVTDIPRTLLDCLRSPGKAGGLACVFRAWREARPLVDVAQVTRYTERLGGPVMRQRIGFILEQLGLDGASLKDWQAGVQRGGSAKLLPSEPYSPTYSERWCLSLNVPDSVLSELKD